MTLLIGTPWAREVGTTIVVGAEVDCLAAERAATIDERLTVFGTHGDGKVAEKGLGGVVVEFRCCFES